MDKSRMKASDKNIMLIKNKNSSISKAH